MYPNIDRRVTCARQFIQPIFDCAELGDPDLGFFLVGNIFVKTLASQRLALLGVLADDMHEALV